MRCDFGDVVLVRFPFTDLTTTKKRPAVVVSSPAYHRQRLEVVVMAISGQPPTPSRGDLAVSHWHEAGLLKASFIKPVFATLDHHLVLRKLGRLDPEDRALLDQALRHLLGP